MQCCWVLSSCGALGGALQVSATGAAPRSGRSKQVIAALDRSPVIAGVQGAGVAADRISCGWLLVGLCAAAAGAMPLAAEAGRWHAFACGRDYGNRWDWQVARL